MKLKKMVSAATAGLLALGISISVVGPAHADDVTPGTYNTVPPTRVLDTRSGTGPIAPLATVTFHIPDQLSPRIGAVLLEVTAVNPSASGYATVFGAGAPRPVVSTLNFRARQNVPNMVVVQVTSNYDVSIYNGSKGTVDLLADIQGYFVKGTNAGDPGTLVPVKPTRDLDTRAGLGAPKGQVAPLSVTKVKVAGLAGVPSTASAVAINVTAVNSPGAGYITAYPGEPRPVTSTVNFQPRQDRANLALAQIGTDGTISLYNGSPYPVDLLADVTGYFVGGGSAAADGSYTPSSTVRAYDTRRNTGDEVALGALETRKVPIFDAGDPFASYIKAVSVNITAVNPQAAGYFTTWDGTTTVPAVSNVNFQVQKTAAGSIVVPVNPDGTISIRNGSFGSVDLLVDFNGLFFQLPVLVTARTPNAAHSAPSAAQVLAHVKTFLTAQQSTAVAGR